MPHGGSPSQHPNRNPRRSPPCRRDVETTAARGRAWSPAPTLQPCLRSPRRDFRLPRGPRAPGRKYRGLGRPGGKRRPCSTPHPAPSLAGPLASRRPAPYLGRSEPGPQSAQGPPIGRKAPARSVHSGRAYSGRPSPVTAEGRRRRRRGPRQRPTPKSPHRGPRTQEEEAATAPECERGSRRRRRTHA